MSSRLNSNAPWFCHECHSEMQAEMHPNPICSVCHSDFVEQLDPASTNDPRNFDHDPVAPGFDIPPFDDDFPQPGYHDHDRDVPHPPPHVNVHDHDLGPDGGNLPDLLSLLLGRMALAEGQAGGVRRNGPDAYATRGSGMGSNGSAGSREWMFRLGPGTMRVSTGTMAGRGGPGELLFPLPPSSPIRSRSPSSGNQGTPQGLGLPDTFHQYIMGFLGGADSFGSPSGSARMGDYVLTQEGLDTLMTQLMEAGGGGSRARPASRETVQSLPRSTVRGGSEMTTRDCAVCKDGFEAGQETVALPCSHSFHNDCILPWLEINGTCPVCRTAVSANESSSAPEAPSRSPSSPSAPPSGRRPSSSPRSTPRQPNSPNPWSPTSSRRWSRGGGRGGQGGDGSGGMPGGLPPDDWLD